LRTGGTKGDVSHPKRPSLSLTEPGTGAEFPSSGLPEEGTHRERKGRRSNCRSKITQALKEEIGTGRRSNRPREEGGISEKKHRFREKGRKRLTGKK